MIYQGDSGDETRYDLTASATIAQARATEDMRCTQCGGLIVKGAIIDCPIFPLKSE